MSHASEATRRAVGAIVGAAVGDALGAPFEFNPPGTYRRRFPAPVPDGIGEMTGGGGWDPGEFTDDTQMAIMVAESLLDRYGVDQDDLEQRFKAWVASGPKDVGISTRAVLTDTGSAVEAATAYFAAHPTGAAGNGSLMRTIPAAVRFARDGTEATMDAARAISAVTHGDPATGEGCAIYHELTRVALDGGDPLAAIPTALDRVDPDQRRQYAAVLDPDWAPADATMSNGTVWIALAQAVWAIRHTDSFEEALVAAIDLGDDADTVGAITGGLAGAVYGPGEIPSRWATYVHGHLLGRTYRLRDLQDMARRLAGADPAPLTPDPPPIEPSGVLPGLWLTNLTGARDAPDGAAVISLCRTKGYFDHVTIRREVFLMDSDGANPSLGRIIDDIVMSIAAFQADGLPVVVHCHGGASRTGLALRAWLMHTEGLTEAEATERAQQLWPHTATWTQDFTEALKRREP